MYSRVTYIIALDVCWHIVSVQSRVKHRIHLGTGTGHQTLGLGIGVPLGESQPIRARLRDRQGGESSERQSWITRGKARNELRSQAKDSVEVQGRVKGLGEGRILANLGANVGGVTALDGQDGTGGSEVGFGGNGTCGTEVGGHADAFEDGGEGEEGFGVCGREGVGCLVDGGGA